MIVDARTIALLFVDGLSALLIAALCVIAAVARWGSRPSSELEGLSSLLALCAAALLALRIVAWALFFLVLDGYVPSLTSNGVMCAFGVVQLRPELAHAALWAKPLAIGALLIWWSLAYAEAERGGAVFLRLRFATIAPVAALIALEVVCETNWIGAEKLTAAVTCCSAALDPARTVNGFRSTAILGLSSTSILAVLFACKLLLTGLCVRASRADVAPKLSWTLPFVALSSAIALLDLVAWREAVAPRALGLEFHRCAYELVTRSIALGPVALLAALAHLALFALPVLALLHAREPIGTQRAALGIVRLAELCFATELAALAVHVF